jgi:hypothetical protein
MRGPPKAIFTGLNKHLAASTNHVGIQLRIIDDSASPIPGHPILAQNRPTQT